MGSYIRYTLKGNFYNFLILIFGRYIKRVREGFSPMIYYEVKTSSYCIHQIINYRTIVPSLHPLRFSKFGLVSILPSTLIFFLFFY